MGIIPQNFGKVILHWSTCSHRQINTPSEDPCKHALGERYNFQSSDLFDHWSFFPDSKWDLGFDLPVRKNSSCVSCAIGPGFCFTQRFWAHNPNLAKIYVALTWKIMIRSGHNFAHAMTAERSWHVQNFYLIVSAKSKVYSKWFSQNFNYELINALWDRSQAITSQWKNG